MGDLKSSFREAVAALAAVLSMLSIVGGSSLIAIGLYLRTNKPGSLSEQNVAVSLFGWGLIIASIGVLLGWLSFRSRIPPVPAQEAACDRPGRPWLRSFLLLVLGTVAGLLILLGGLAVLCWVVSFLAGPTSQDSVLMTGYAGFAAKTLPFGILFAVLYRHFALSRGLKPRTGAFDSWRRFLGAVMAAGGYALIAFGAYQAIVAVIAAKGTVGVAAPSVASIFCLAGGILLVWVGRGTEMSASELEAVFQMDLPSAFNHSQDVQATTAARRWRAIGGYLMFPLGVFAVWLSASKWVFSIAGLIDCLVWSVGLMAGFSLIVLVHEIGHGVVGVLVGMRWVAVTLGDSGKIWSGDIAGVRFTIHANAWWGAAYVYPRTARHYKLREFLMIAGGPLFHSFAVALLILAYLQEAGPYQGGMAGLLALAGGGVLLLSLFPTYEARGGRRYLSDGFHSP